MSGARDVHDLEGAKDALERMVTEMGAAIHHLEAATMPGLSPGEAQGHREDGELYAFFARQHAERCDPDALARALGLDEGALSERSDAPAAERSQTGAEVCARQGLGGIEVSALARGRPH